MPKVDPHNPADVAYFITYELTDIPYSYDLENTQQVGMAISVHLRQISNSNSRHPLVNFHYYSLVYYFCQAWAEDRGVLRSVSRFKKYLKGKPQNISLGQLESAPFVIPEIIPWLNPPSQLQLLLSLI